MCELLYWKKNPQFPLSPETAACSPQDWRDVRRRRKKSEKDKKRLQETRKCAHTCKTAREAGHKDERRATHPPRDKVPREGSLIQR
ncbi:hypothetical protein ACU8KH_03859 [Lachancea thermotolerans]